MKKVGDALDRLLKVMLGACMVGITILLCVEVTARYFLKISITWTDETAKLLLIWMTFCGLGIGIKEKVHVRVIAIHRLVPPRMQKAADIGTHLLGIGLAIFLFFFGIGYAQSNISMTFPILGISYAWRAIAVPIGAVLMFFFCSIELLSELKTYKDVAGEGYSTEN